MPFYDESGKAIISKPRPPKTKYVSPEFIGPLPQGTEYAPGPMQPPKKVHVPLTQKEIKTDISKMQVDVVRTPFAPSSEEVKAVMQLQKTKKQVSDFPKGTTFAPTKTGYDVIIPETVKLDWAKHYLKEAKKAPPIISEISRFGLGLQSSMFSVAKPVANIFGFGKKFDQIATLGMSIGLHYPFSMKKDFATSFAKGTKAGKYGIHYPSVLDIGFEPIGWSPKGSSEFVRSDPFFFAGGVGGEVAQSVAFTAALRPVGEGIKIGTKGVIKRAPGIYSKFTKVFPEEKLLRPTIRKTSSIITRGQSDLLGRLFKWGGKGYKFGKKVLPYGPKKPPHEVVKGAFYTKSVSQKTILGGGKRIVRSLMSPDEYISAQKNLAKYLSQKPTYDIMFPRSVEGLQPFIHKTGAYHMTWGGKLVKKSKFLYAGITPEGRVAFSSRPALEKAFYNIPSKYGGCLRDFKFGQKQIHSKFQKPWSGIIEYDELVKHYPTVSMKVEKTSDVIDLIRGTRAGKFKVSFTPDVRKVAYRHGIARRGISPEWASEVSRMLEKGYRPSSISSLIKGTGKPLMKDITSLAQKERASWLIRQKMRFWKSISGVQQVVPKPSLTTLRTRTVGMFRPKTGFGRAAVSLPSTSISPLFAPPLIHVGIKTGLGIQHRELKAKPTILVDIERNIQKTKPAIIQVQTPVKDTIVKPIILLGQIQTPITDKRQDVFLLQRSKVKTKMAMSMPIPFPTTKRALPLIPFIPSSGLYGRGRMFYDADIYGLKYKYREFKIPSLSEISKQITKQMSGRKPLL